MSVALHLWIHQLQYFTLFNSNLFARADQFKGLTPRLLKPVTEFGTQIMLLPKPTCRYGL